MISEKKLLSLRPKTRLSQIVSIIRLAEQALGSHSAFDPVGVGMALRLLCAESGIEESKKKRFETHKRHYESLVPSDNPREIQRILNSCRHGILEILGRDPAEWNLWENSGSAADEQQTARERPTFPIAVYLDDLRSPFNVGSIFRTAETFGVRHIYLSEETPKPNHPRAKRTARGCERVVNWQVREQSHLYAEENLFALELGGEPVEFFNFPTSGIVVVGNEELGVSHELLALADKKCGRVSIVGGGYKASLNVSVAFAILIHQWFQRLSTAQK